MLLASVLCPHPPPTLPRNPGTSKHSLSRHFTGALAACSPEQNQGETHQLLVVSCCPCLPQGLRNDTHRIGPAQGCGTGELPAVLARAKEGGIKDQWEQSLAPPTSPSSGVSKLHHSVCLQKTVPSHPGCLYVGGPFRQPKFYPLGRDSEKSSNSLQELADEQRLRKLSTRGRRRW